MEHNGKLQKLADKVSLFFKLAQKPPQSMEYNLTCQPINPLQTINREDLRLY